MSKQHIQYEWNHEIRRENVDWFPISALFWKRVLGKMFFTSIFSSKSFTIFVKVDPIYMKFELGSYMGMVIKICGRLYFHEVDKEIGNETFLKPISTYFIC